MASIEDGQIYNTQLFNVVLEAMDNFKPILVCAYNGSAQFLSELNDYRSTGSGDIDLMAEVVVNGNAIEIYPSSNATAADLYVPQNISPYSVNGSVS